MAAVQIPEELKILYFLPSTDEMIISLKIRWVEHVECRVEIRNAYKIYLNISREDIASETWV
jgi:hypothetical protein